MSTYSKVMFFIIATSLVTGVLNALVWHNEGLAFASLGFLFAISIPFGFFEQDKNSNVLKKGYVTVVLKEPVRGIHTHGFGDVIDWQVIEGQHRFHMTDQTKVFWSDDIAHWDITREDSKTKVVRW